MLKKSIIIVSLMMLVSACASFYEASTSFNEQFENGNIDQALTELKSDKQYQKSNVQFLYYLNLGLLRSMKGDYVKSNKAFERAYLFGEDYKVNYLAEAASYLTNPTITVYRGEDHEHLMPLYYKALNFLKMNQYEEALVECRRLNIRLQQLSDKYKNPKKYQRDAFIHNLMGIIYQANGDWNNAFIAYRNALEIYDEDYTTMFNLSAPDQLKKDLLISAWHMGFTEEYNTFRDKFGWSDFNPAKQPDADLVFFWHNGLGPVKSEWSINFAITGGPENLFVLENEGQTMSFPFQVYDKDERSSLSDLRMFRVAFPKYVERPLYFNRGEITTAGQTYPLQVAEDINQIAFKSLQDRMALEFSKTLIRAALKKAAEESLRKESKGWGAVLGAVNAFTEKADTRNWQTLPHSIAYTRVPLQEGTNETSLTLTTPDGRDSNYSFTYTVKKGQTLFHTFTSLEAKPANY
ncbi:MAG: hypothetical protein JNK18_17325 [Cyclobacteriaceae bacterium]|nr:hypothetical protein [Cyclobacteriaceae bacterium]